MTIISIPPQLAFDIALNATSAPPAPSVHTDDEESEVRGSSFPRCADGNGTLAGLFFSEDDYDIARAKAICGPCGLAASCLDGAIERGEPYGVWGGKLLVDGVPVEFKRKRGRPRKNPAPLLVVPEVPIPEHLVA